MSITLFARRLKRIRKARRMTQAELARRMGLSRPHFVSEAENGRFLFSGETLRALARIFGVEPEYFTQPSYPDSFEGREQR